MFSVRNFNETLNFILTWTATSHILLHVNIHAALIMEPVKIKLGFLFFQERRATGKFFNAIFYVHR